ncbi:helix-turn-helix transcriptional regulator [Prauserella muralis]|uniref:Uncharacterized protein n=1 Tax=Prauserella muralis TaxID=588067 RepID=A0A2V4AHL5_9PSEU|nr:helix-turn-helix transcriptional regulator [Prauserella muralis]PXY19422.1 hypothetical protein BAY60_32280 [Prauserella muralis]TWE29395.1 AraC-like DNA-binding protein [Prauserella muralis]
MDTDVAPTTTPAVDRQLAERLGILIARFVRDLAEAPALPPGRQLADALASRVLAELGEPAPPGDGDDLADRILAYCLANLADPELSVETVAGAHGISTRYLQKVLRRRKIRLWAWIRSRRLERIRDDLRDPRLAHRTVSAVAARWGVTDATHLSRALKAEFGRTATQIRHGSRPSGRLS